MATVELNELTIAAAVKDAPMLLVDFWAAWCGPCQRFGPIFEAASVRHPEVVFGKVDTDANQGLAMDLEVQAIPTLMAFKNGTLVFRQPGVLNSAQLDDLIDRINQLELPADEAPEDFD